MLSLQFTLAWPTSVAWSAWHIVGSVLLAVTAYCVLSCVRQIVFNAGLFRHVNGPRNPSILLGNFADFFERDIVDVCLDWTARYGGVVRFWAFLGEPRVMITDPVALQHIFVKRWSTYIKQPDFARFVRCLMGPGLLASEGAQYKRQKFAIQRGFTPPSVRAYYPIFVQHARLFRHRLVQRVKDGGNGDAGVMTDMLRASARASLDIIAHAGFGEPFGALHEDPASFGGVTDGASGKRCQQDLRTSLVTSDHALARAFDDLVGTASTQAATTFQLLYDVAVMFVPALLWLPFQLADHSVIRRSRKVMDDEADKVIEKARAAMQNKCDGDDDDVGGNDDNNNLAPVLERKQGSIIGMLVRAQLMGQRRKAASSPPASPIARRHYRNLQDKATLTSDDVRGQVTTLMLAGHETTSTQLAWLFLSLARHPDVQEKLREAIQAKRVSLGLTSRSRSWQGDDKEEVQRLEHVDGAGDLERDLTMEEVESITYLDWCVQESLRLYGPVHTSARVPLHDDVIPVDAAISPGVPAGGLRIRGSAIIMIPIEAINRMPSLWGQDADSFNPSRWANAELPGVRRFRGRSGGATFLIGPRACIGALFAVAEIKTILSVVMTDIAMRDSGRFVARSRWVVTRPYDCTARCEQCPVTLMHASSATPNTTAA